MRFLTSCPLLCLIFVCFLLLWNKFNWGLPQLYKVKLSITPVTSPAHYMKFEYTSLNSFFLKKYLIRKYVCPVIKKLYCYVLYKERLYLMNETFHVIFRIIAVVEYLKCLYKIILPSQLEYQLVKKTACVQLTWKDKNNLLDLYSRQWFYNVSYFFI